MDGGARRMRRLAILLAALAVVGAVALALRTSDRWPQIVSLWRNGSDNALDLSAAAGLRLEALTVEGRANTNPDDILAALDVERGTPILSINVADAREAIESLPWVKTARVERQLPNALHVMIEERAAYALWQRGGRYTLIDAGGHAIVDVPGQIGELPLIVGTDAPAHAFELFEALKAQPELMQRVRGAVRIGERRWNLHFDSFESGIAVRLPESGLSEAITRLAGLQRDHKILERDLSAIDLRLADRLIVQLHKDPAAQTAAPKPNDKRPSAAKSAKQNV
ncbi:MAG: FtsQ-type POTRA domain-containing protein [Rhodospirillaceae bacterium]|nr:FtsQ-type POTRA domain-containing protein [Rhodospirillaceae bacterium]